MRPVSYRVFPAGMLMLFWTEVALAAASAVLAVLTGTAQAARVRVRARRGGLVPWPVPRLLRRAASG